MGCAENGARGTGQLAKESRWFADAPLGILEKGLADPAPKSGSATLFSTVVLSQIAA